MFSLGDCYFEKSPFGIAVSSVVQGFGIAEAWPTGQGRVGVPTSEWGTEFEREPWQRWLFGMSSNWAGRFFRVPFVGSFERELDEKTQFRGFPYFETHPMPPCQLVHFFWSESQNTAFMTCQVDMRVLFHYDLHV